MQEKKPIVIVGEVLFDQFENGRRVLGGAPFNVAWHLQAFGVSPVFVSRVGQDASGDQILSAMHAWGMTVAAVQRDADHPTGVVAVTLQQGEPDYHIVPDSAWDFIDKTALPDLSDCGILYHGSLAFRQAVSAQCLPVLLNSTASRFVDVNLRHPWWQLESVKQMLQGASWIKLNRDEKRSLDWRLDESPANVILTAGKTGAQFFSRQGESLQIIPETAVQVKDVVGAGDAFSSIVLLGIYRQWPIAQTLQRAQQFASAIVGIQGATTQDVGFYEKFRQAWNLT